MCLETPLTLPSVRYSKIVSFRVSKRRADQPHSVRRLEVRGGIEPPMKVFETLALPLACRVSEPLFP
jgi:hypothetical protein